MAVGFDIFLKPTAWNSWRPEAIATPWIGACVSFVIITAAMLRFMLKTRKGKIARCATGYVPFVGHIFYFRPEKYLPFVYRNWKSMSGKSGDDFEVYFLGKRLLVTSDWNIAKEVLMRRPRVFHRDKRADNWAPDAGLTLGIIRLEGAEWSRMRHLISPSFTQQAITSMSGLVFKEAAQLVDRLKDDCKGELHFHGFPVFQKYTLSVVCRLAFGDAMDNIDYLRGDGIAKDINNMFRWMYRRSVSVFPPSFWHVYRDQVERDGTSAVKRLDGVVSEVLRNYRKGQRSQGPGEATFLKTLMEATEKASEAEGEGEGEEEGGGGGGGEETKEEGGRRLTDEEVAAQVKLFIIAGTETTSTLISATVWQLCLAANAPLVNELRAEVDRVLGEDMSVRTLAQWEQLDLVRATLKETNRLYGPIHNLGVQPAFRNQPLPGGYIMQPQDHVVVNIMGINRDPAVYDNPEEFFPQRWLGTHTGPDKLKIMEDRFLSFGYGPRVCPGNRLAMMEGVCGLANLIKNFDMALDCPDAEIKRMVNFTATLNKLPLCFKMRS